MSPPAATSQQLVAISKYASARPSATMHKCSAAEPIMRMLRASTRTYSTEYTQMEFNVHIVQYKVEYKLNWPLQREHAATAQLINDGAC